MKQLRLLALALAATAFAASLALACPDDKTAAAGSHADCCGAGKTTATSASTAGMNKACSAAMAAQCTAAMKAQCAKGASATAASAANCPMHAGMKTTATAANAGCAMHGTTASAASATKAATKATKEKEDGCCMGNASATASSKPGASCAMHGSATAMAAGAKCDAHQMANHADCGACVDIASCEDDVRATGAHQQVVSLKNGAMLVYTADNSEAIRSLQQAVARHNEKIMAALSGDGKLCSDCKQLRGALASGKMTREIVNINSGCQVLMTSSDRNIVSKIHTMTAGQMAARVKS